MAARKLKFKPKPLVNAVRRARDKEEIPELTGKEPEVIKELHSHSNENDVASSPKKLKMEHTSSTENVSSLRTEVGPSQISEKSSKAVDDSLSFNEVNSVLPNMDTSTSNNEDKHPKLDQISSIDLMEPCSTNIPNSESNINENKQQSVVTNSISSDITSNSSKPEVVKIGSRFSRTKCKPVLGGVRKKNDTLTESTDPGEVCTRTVSVIKSVQVELSKIRSVPEVTENVSTLEIEKDISSLTNEQYSNKLSCHNDDSETPSTTITEENLPCSLKISTSNTPSSIITSCTTNQTISCNTPDSATTSSNTPNSTTVSHNIVVSLSLTDSSNLSNKTTALHEKPADVNTITLSTTSNKVPISPLKAIAKVLAPKPSPRLRDGARRISFQGSDSEDETKRKSQSVQESKPAIKEKKQKDLKNTKRKRSQGSTYSKLGQDTLQKFEKKFGNDKEPDKNKLTMLDFIFYNPKSNPMSASSQLPSNKKKKEKIEVSEAVEEILEEQQVDDVESSQTPMAVPQLKVGPDGQIMLDPKSLIIETTGTQKSREELEKSEVIRDTGITRYNTYSKKRQQRNDWTPQETLQFYRALNTIGSDFAIMAKLFPRRSRHELKLKFKREERSNLRLIDKAISNPADFDFKLLEEELKLENEEIERRILEKAQAKELAKKERLIKREEKLKSKKNRNTSSGTTTGNCVRYSEFDDGERMQLIAKNKKPLLRERQKKRTRRKKFKKSDSDSSFDDELQIDLDIASRASSHVDSDAESREIVKMVRETIAGRITKPTKKLEEYEELNETLKKNLQNNSESEEDAYIPNGPAADELYGSPRHDSQANEEKLWDIEISACPTIEETIIGNMEEVSEISELGSFGQDSVTALDLSVMRDTSLVGTENHVENTVLNRKLISESIQIIDQLTSNVEGGSYSKEQGGSDSKEVNPSQENVVDKIPLPGFESMSRSRPVVLYSTNSPFVPLDNSSKENIMFNVYNIDEDNEYIIGN